MENKKPGPKPRGIKRRSISMTDAQWGKLLVMAEGGSVSAVVCKLIDRQTLNSSDDSKSLLVTTLTPVTIHASFVKAS